MTCTVNNKQSFPQELLHKIVNNKRIPRRKEPSQLWFLFNEVINII